MINVLLLFLPGFVIGFNTCCDEGEVLDVLDLPAGSHPPCVTYISEISTISKSQLLGGKTSTSIKYPRDCIEFELFEVTC